MLKSFKFIEELNSVFEHLVHKHIVDRYHIKLSVNQMIDIYVSSDHLSSIDDLKNAMETNNLLSLMDVNDLYISSVFFNFYSIENASMEIEHYLTKGKTDHGLRRSLDNLIENAYINESKESNVITFYSHKGGVGRTTSLSLLAGYLSELGKKIFIIDCDFEAPGLLNFFSVSQFNTPKGGVIEYLNDKKFDENVLLDENYVYEISNKYTGEGSIYLMPAGNVFSIEKDQYLEGLSRLDIYGPTVFMDDMRALISEIQKTYNPDLILIDSRTGFNSVFGALSKISDHIVALFGDNIQNRPGIEFILNKYVNSEIKGKLTIALSIVSSGFRSRLTKLNGIIAGYLNEKNCDEIIPSFVFSREPALELIGTEDESIEDFKHFSSRTNPTSYTPFLSHMEDVLASLLPITEEADYDYDKVNESSYQTPDNCHHGIVNPEEDEKNTLSNTYQNSIIEDIINNFPELYAENILLEESFLRKKFYLRKCMQDIFLPEYKLLIGGKGTGKTFFYKALQEQHFVNALISRAEKEKQKFHVFNIISEQSQSNGFFELTSHFNDEIQDESFVRKFWIIYIWCVLSKKLDYFTSSCDFEITNNAITADKITSLINNKAAYVGIEKELIDLDQHLKKNDERLLIVFDQLDVVVKPIEWNHGISPLIRICQSNSWDRIQPKLFLRRDLFEKLGNITNKQSLESQVIDLEWSADEMYAFFFKVVSANSCENFNSFVIDKLGPSFANENIIKKLRKKNSYNQLPDNEFILRPLVNAFFGKPNLEYLDAYDALYRNIRNANQTISLRPFLDMIKFAIDEQIADGASKRNDSVLGIDYCFYRSVRAKAVERYFQDMANEAGNDVIKYFIEDIQNNKVPDELKCSSLIQKDFEKLVSIVKNNHPHLKPINTTTFEEMLKLNGIIFVTLIPGGIKKFSFAYLYKFYLNLRSPTNRRKTREKQEKTGENLDY